MLSGLMTRQFLRAWKHDMPLFLAMLCSVSLYVFALNTSSFANRSMQLIMKDMGLNQVLIPESSHPLDYFLCSEKQASFPEDIADTMASHNELLSRYYVALLQERIELNGKSLILTGVRPISRAADTAEKGNPVKPIKKGSVKFGSGAAEVLACPDEGKTFMLKGAEFIVEGTDSPTGDMDDWRIYMNLSDLQALLGKKGMISAVRSFECLHPGGSLERIHDYQNELLAGIVPGYRQINLEKIAKARHRSRDMTDRYLRFILLFTSLLMIIVTAVTGMKEASDRKYEIGILSACGAGIGSICATYILKIFLLAFLAGISGFLIGSYASLYTISPYIVSNTRQFSILWSNLPSCSAFVIISAALGSAFPLFRFISCDPASILMEE